MSKWLLKAKMKVKVGNMGFDTDYESSETFQSIELMGTDNPFVGDFNLLYLEEDSVAMSTDFGGRSLTRKGAERLQLCCKCPRRIDCLAIVDERCYLDFIDFYAE